MVTLYDGACQCAPSKRQIAHWYRMLEVTIIAKIQTLSIENIFYDGDIVRWRMSMRTLKAPNCAVVPYAGSHHHRKNSDSFHREYFL
jgi:hypothetical protein